MNLPTEVSDAVKWKVTINGPWGPEVIQYNGKLTEEEVRSRLVDDRPMCGIISMHKNHEND